MEEIKLDVQIRNQIGRRKVKVVRQENFIPAIVYGGERKEPTAIKVDRRSYEKIMRVHKGESVVFHLSVMENDKKLRDYAAIVKEEQHHPVSESLLHIDFNRISLTKEIEVKVPVIPRGEAIGVKKDGGSLDSPLRELDIVCLPTNIPANIEIDISALNIGDVIHVKDIVLPENVKTNHDPESIVVSVVPSMKEEAAEPVGEVGPEEPEVIKEKKEKEVTAEKESGKNAEEK